MYMVHCHQKSLENENSREKSLPFFTMIFTSLNAVSIAFSFSDFNLGKLHFCFFSKGSIPHFSITLPILEILTVISRLSLTHLRISECAVIITSERVRRFVFEWSRGESNPCPKNHSLSFYYHSALFNFPSFKRQCTASKNR